MKILITDECHETLPLELVQGGHQVDYKPKIPLLEIDKVISEYDGIVINTRVKMDMERISKGQRLKFIARLGSGLDIIDLDFARTRGVDVLSSPEGNRRAVAEHALAMLLALMNKLFLSRQQVIQNLWDREAARGLELSGRSIGIIGYGNTGGQFARLLAGFGVDIHVYDKYKEILPTEIFDSRLMPNSLEKVLNISQIVSFHLPLTCETEDFISDDLITQCKPGVILVNTARGKLSNLKTFLKHLDSGQIGGLCLDVFPEENFESFSEEYKQDLSRLAKDPRVIVSPHVAGWTVESKFKIAKILLEKIENLVLIRKVL